MSARDDYPNAAHFVAAMAPPVVIAEVTDALDEIDRLRHDMADQRRLAAIGAIVEARIAHLDRHAFSADDRIETQRLQRLVKEAKP